MGSDCLAQASTEGQPWTIRNRVSILRGDGGAGNFYKENGRMPPPG